MKRFDIKEKLSELLTAQIEWCGNIRSAGAKILAVKSEIISAFNSREWVSVDERLPDNDDDIFCICDNRYKVSFYRPLNGWGGRNLNVTHWMTPPTEHVDIDSRIEHISSEKPLNIEQIKAVNELVEKAYNMDFSANKKSYITELIDKYFNQESEWRHLKPSIEHYLNKGKATGGFYCALIKFASAYYKRASIESPKRPLSQLADDLETCRDVAELLNCSFRKAALLNGDVVRIDITSRPSEEDDGTWDYEFDISTNGSMEIQDNSIIPNCFQIVQLLLSRGYEVG